MVYNNAIGINEIDLFIMIHESYIDRKYRLLLFDTCQKKPELTKLQGKTCWSLECPLCSAKGAQLVWLPHKSTWKFLCSTKSRKNCQVQMEFPVLLKSWCKSLFLSYQQERTDAGTAGAGFNCPRPISTSVRRAPLKSCGSAKCQDQTQVSGISTST
jgi:hypothetical protein